MVSISGGTIDLALPGRAIQSILIGNPKIEPSTVTASRTFDVAASTGQLDFKDISEYIHIQ